MVLAGLISSSVNNGSRIDIGLGLSILSIAQSESSISLLTGQCGGDSAGEGSN